MLQLFDVCKSLICGFAKFKLKPDLRANIDKPWNIKLQPPYSDWEIQTQTRILDPNCQMETRA